MEWITLAADCLPIYFPCVAPSPLPGDWVQHSIEGQSDCLEWISTGSTVVPDAFSSPGLPDCTSYSWQVRARSPGAPDTEIRILSDMGDFTVNASGACCTAELVPDAPTLTMPASYEIVHPNAPGPLVPHIALAWENPDGACQPNGYSIELAADHGFSDPSLNGEVVSPETTYDVPVGLRAATQYWWKVAARGLGESGAFSEPRSFFTGPDCTAASQLTAPELFSPDDDAVLYENVATLHFQAGSPGCIPDGYFVDLQTSETFAGENLLGEFNQPGTTVITDPLEDCTTYYWRVAAFKDWYRGPFSETRTFFTRTAPLCPERMHVTLVSRDALCRLGPAMQYPVVDTRTAGSQAEVVGRSADAGWLVITRSTGSGTCFMKRELLDFAGDVEPLPVIVAPPLPTLTPTAESPGLVCSASLNATQCATARGKWIITSWPGYCACP